MNVETQRQCEIAITALASAIQEITRAFHPGRSAARLAADLEAAEFPLTNAAEALRAARAAATA